jgi:superfamily II DNA or RNA helicase
MSKHERRFRVAQFRKGEVQVLTNCELLTTGIDIPEIEVGIMLRPTMSLSLAIQQGGRILRPSPGKKEAILLDHANNTARFGLLTEDREWSLDDRDKKANKSDTTKTAVRLCQVCFAANPPWKSTCSYCGHVFEIQSRKIEEVEGELQEIDPKIIRKIEQGSARSLEALIELGRLRGYKSSWAHHVFNARRK